MKRLMLAILLVGFATVASAAVVELNFAWDANTEPDLDLYTLHRGTTNGGPYTSVLDIEAPAVSTAYSLTGNYGQTFYFVLTASDTTTAPDTTPPAAPKNFRAWLSRIIQAIQDWWKGGFRVS